MEITSLFGYEYFKTLNGHQFDTLTNYGKMDFTVNNLNGGRSRFKFETVGERTWLSTVPTTGDRSEDRYYDNTCTSYDRRWVSTGNYSWSGYWKTYCVRRRGWRTDWTATYAKRRTDSSRRTPSFNVPITDLVNGDDESRFVTFGIRLQYPNINQLPSAPLTLVKNGGNVDYNDQIAMLLHQNEIPEENGAVVYVEAVVDRHSGLLRRWVNDVEVQHRTISTVEARNLNSYHLAVGSKNISYNASAPPNALYRVNDIYVAVSDDPNDLRLGPIEVKDLNVENFELNRHWLAPTSADTPTETVNRIKTDSTPKNTISGDTHADPGVASMNAPSLNLEDDEVLYVEIDVYGHTDGESGASHLNVKTLNGDIVVGNTQLPLNNNTLPSTDVKRRIYTYKKISGHEKNPLEDLRLKVTFS